MEFCTKRELQNQTGHSVHDWPLVALKELMDNALDACEEAEIAPVISIHVCRIERHGYAAAGILRSRIRRGYFLGLPGRFTGSTTSMTGDLFSIA
jgi:hypothetical protein